jgi:hypothetical protein
MITIFCDFWRFSAKKLAFFSKTNVMITILHNLALISVKNAIFFAEFFGENIFKIITSVPGLRLARKFAHKLLFDNSNKNIVPKTKRNWQLIVYAIHIFT